MNLGMSSFLLKMIVSSSFFIFPLFLKMYCKLILIVKINKILFLFLTISIFCLIIVNILFADFWIEVSKKFVGILEIVHSFNHSCLIIQFSLFFIGEYLIGLRYFLELLFSILIILIFVWMELQG